MEEANRLDLRGGGVDDLLDPLQLRRIQRPLSRRQHAPPGLDYLFLGQIGYSS